MASWKIRRRVVAALLALSLSGIASNTRAEIGFARDGVAIDALALDTLRERFPATWLRVHEPYEDREVRFEAIRLDALLDALYTPTWREDPDRLFLFTCRDGYQPTIPVARVLEHKAWLAFARDSPTGFAIHKFESGSRKRISLAPFYLIWENLDDAQVRREGDYGWPYQLVGVDLVRAEDRFPRMTPPPDASARAKAGFAAFRIHCSRCHTVNGEGGAIGPELNPPQSPAAHRDREWLARWIDDPSQFAAGARMPRLALGTAKREETIENLILYLEAMADAKRGAALER